MAIESQEVDNEIREALSAFRESGGPKSKEEALLAVEGTYARDEQGEMRTSKGSPSKAFLSVKHFPAQREEKEKKKRLLSAREGAKPSRKRATSPSHISDTPDQSIDGGERQEDEVKKSKEESLHSQEEVQSKEETSEEKDNVEIEGLEEGKGQKEKEQRESVTEEPKGILKKKEKELPHYMVDKNPYKHMSSMERAIKKVKETNINVLMHVGKVDRDGSMQHQ